LPVHIYERIHKFGCSLPFVRVISGRKNILIQKFHDNLKIKNLEIYYKPKNMMAWTHLKTE